MSTTTATKSLFDLSKSTIERMKKEELIALLEAEGFKGVPQDIKRTDLSAFAFECIAFRKEVAEAEASDLVKFGNETEESFVQEVEQAAELAHLTNFVVEGLQEFDAQNGGGADSLLAQDATDENQASIEASFPEFSKPILSDEEYLLVCQITAMTDESVATVIATAQQYIAVEVASTLQEALQMVLEDIPQPEPKDEIATIRTFTRQELRTMTVNELNELAATHNIVTKGVKREDLRKQLTDILCPPVSKEIVTEFQDRLTTDSKGQLCREMHDAGYRPVQIALTLSMHPSHVQTVLVKHRKTAKSATND